MQQLNTVTNYQAGESLRQEFTIKEGDNPWPFVDQADISWMLLDSSGDDDPLLSDSDSGISIEIIDETEGRFDIVIDKGLTNDYAGDTLWERLVIEWQTEKQVYSGSFRVLKP